MFKVWPDSVIEFDVGDVIAIFWIEKIEEEITAFFPQCNIDGPEFGVHRGLEIEYVGWQHGIPAYRQRPLWVENQTYSTS